MRPRPAIEWKARNDHHTPQRSSCANRIPFSHEPETCHVTDVIVSRLQGSEFNGSILDSQASPKGSLGRGALIWGLGGNPSIRRMQQPRMTPARSAILFLRRPTTTWKPAAGSCSNKKPIQCISGSPSGTGKQKRKRPPVGVVVSSTTEFALGFKMARRRSSVERAGCSLIDRITSCGSSPQAQHQLYGVTAQESSVSEEAQKRRPPRCNRRRH